MPDSRAYPHAVRELGGQGTDWGSDANELLTPSPPVIAPTIALAVPPDAPAKLVHRALAQMSACRIE
ncbi:MAG: hypothetical protein H0U76_31100 [Ktedonobacteraceae bacterium]|nr:hypothetical protein [Ktedonobacteraceae bacterium]